jgi:hypothetical protein
LISSPNPLILLNLLIYEGGLVFAILMAQFEGELVPYPVYYIFAFLLQFLHTHLSHFALPVILTCICLIMLITVLG